MKKIKNNYKITYILIFIGIILFPYANSVAHIIKDETLAGVTEEIKKPEYTLKTYLKGEYQQNYDNYYSQNFPYRGVIIKRYNQIRYDLFKKGAVVIGKENYLFEEGYINEYLGIDEQVTNEYINETIENLKVINQKCKEKGKEVYILITPSKADICKEYIPNKYYKMQNKENQRCYDILTKEFQKADIKYFDAYKYLKEIKMEEPKFYKAGTHWSYVSAANTLSEFVKYINSTSKLALRKFKVTGSESSSKPYYAEDGDIYGLLNIYKGNIQEKYYKPILEYKDQNKPSQKVFMQGGSFSWTILEYMKKEEFKNIDFMFYRSMIRSYDQDGSAKEQKLENNELSSEKLEELIQDKDIIILEVNQEHMRKWNNDLIKILKEHLEK